MSSKQNILIAVIILSLFSLLLFIVFGENGLADLNLLKTERDGLISQNEELVQKNLSLYREIERLKNVLLTQQELIAVKTRAKVNFLKNLDSNLGLAFQLAGTETIYGDYHQMFKEVEKIEAITAEDIQRVTKKYFKKSNRTVAMIIPPEDE